MSSSIAFAGRVWGISSILPRAVEFHDSGRLSHQSHSDRSDDVNKRTCYFQDTHDCTGRLDTCRWTTLAARTIHCLQRRPYHYGIQERTDNVQRRAPRGSTASYSYQRIVRRCTLISGNGIAVAFWSYKSLRTQRRNGAHRLKLPTNFNKLSKLSESKTLSINSTADQETFGALSFRPKRHQVHANNQSSNLSSTRLLTYPCREA